MEDLWWEGHGELAGLLDKLPQAIKGKVEAGLGLGGWMLRTSSVGAWSLRS